jgi:mannosyltransferase
MSNRNHEEGYGFVPLAVVGALVVLGAALRLYRLNTGLWFDEIVTVIVSVRQPFLEILTQFPGNNDHPLYSLLAHLSVSLFGESPWTVRLPAVLFGVAAIPALYLLGTAMTSVLEALLAASILTVSYHHIWFSQNARGYTLLLFCVVVSTHLLLRSLAEGRTSLAVAYAIVGALGAYTHLTMVVVCVSHCLVWAVVLVRREPSAETRAAWRQGAIAFGGAGLLTLLMYAPKLGDVQTFFTREVDFGAEVATPMWALWEAVSGLQLGFGALWAIAVGGVIFGAGMWSYFEQNAPALALFLLPIPLTLGLAIATGRPVFPRFVFFALGFGLLITVRGASTVGRWIGEASRARNPQAAAMMGAALVTAGAILVSVQSLPYGYRYPKQDFAGAAAFVEQTRQQDDPVAVVGDTSAIPMRDYLGKAWPRVDREAELRQLLVKGKDVWVVFTFPAYVAAGQPEVWALLRQGCENVATFDGTVAGGAVNVARCRPTGL